MKKLLLLWVFLGAIVAFAHAQNGESNCNDNLDNDGDGLVDCRDCPGKVCEVCNDGIDNDGDGFIDCYDKECSIDAACNGFFIGKDLQCEAKPSTFPEFALTEDFHSPTGVTQHSGKLLVGDVDGDGVPEIVSIYRNKDSEGANDFVSRLSILSSPTNGGTETITKATRLTKGDGVYLQHEGDFAIADVDRDGDAEIFVVSGTRSGTTAWALMAYTYNKTTQSIDKFWTAPISVPADPGNIGLADFDGDGKVELYGRDRIFDAHTGVEMGKGNDHLGTNWRKESSGSTAADILSDSECSDCQGLELIAGCRIYSIAINRSGTTPTATVTKVRERSEYFTRTGSTSDNSTSVADFDLDGYLDVIAVGSDQGNDINTTIFFWSVHKNNAAPAAVNQGALKTFMDDEAYPNGWGRGAGRVNIADIDGDGKLNLVYVSGKYLYALKEGTSSLEQVWRELVAEETSGVTGCTLFDFNADGTSEIVYRDENRLYIFTSRFPEVNGVPDYTQNSTVSSSYLTCKSRTYREYPIVADLDGDGSTEICVTCATNETSAGASLDLYSGARVRVFKSANEPWVPARKVWNQHGYFVVNVNDDLTIPTNQQLHHKVFARNVVCLYGRDSRPLNSFLNQAPFQNSQGCPSFAAPNLSLSKGANQPVNLTIVPPTCPERDFSVSLTIYNTGDVPLTGSVPISFYRGDPQSPAMTAVKLKQVDLEFINVAPGDSVELKNEIITGNGSNFTLYVAINNDGVNNGGTTLPILFPNTNFLECNYADNIFSMSVTPTPADLGVDLIKDNIVCNDGSADPFADGQAKAYIIDANNNNVTQNFTFIWSNGDFVNSPPNYSNNPSDKTGSIYTGLAKGTYTVYARHNTFGCGSEELKIEINDDPVDPPTVEIKDTDLKNPTSCKTANGELGVSVTGGSTNYTYNWVRGLFVDTGTPIGTGSSISGLSGDSYAVRVTDVVTGCTGTANKVLIAPASPTVTADVKDSDCSATPKGEAFVTNVTTNISYIWYKGDATTWFSPSTYKYYDLLPPGEIEAVKYDNLPGGKYSVIAYDNTSLCVSLPVVKEIKQTTPPVVTISGISPQISCATDITKHTGSATASVAGSANFTIQWFKGQNTAGTPFKTETHVNTSTASNLTSGIYSVKVIDEITNCFTVVDQNIEIITDIADYTVVLNTVDKTLCTSDGQVTATVLVDGVADPDQSKYNFFWYKGQSKKPSVDFPANTDNILENAEPRFYTVYAKHTALSCETNIVNAEVLNLVPPINLAFESSVPPSTCTDKGSITFKFLPTDNSYQPSDYSTKWFHGTDTSKVSKRITQFITDSLRNDIGPDMISHIKSLLVGTYTLVVKNPATGCTEVLSHSLRYIDAPEVVVTPTPVTACDLLNQPGTNGSFKIDLVVKDNAINASNYDIYIYKGDYPANPPSSPPPAGFVENHVITNTATTYTFNTTQPYGIGNYTIVAFDRAISCPTEAPATIDDHVTYPAVAKETFDDSYCNIVKTDGNGTVRIIDPVTKSLLSTSDYDFEWFSNSAAIPALTNQNQTNVVRDGLYTIEVKNKITSCMTSIDATVISNEKMISVKATPTDVLNCSADGFTPATDATAEVIEIEETEKGASNTYGAPTFPADYNFQWSDLASTTTYNVVNLDTGFHYVKVTDAVTECYTEKSVEVLDKTKNTVFVDLVDFKKDEYCVNPIAGFLEVRALGSSLNPDDYFYRWTSLDPHIVPADTTKRITGLTHGYTYAIEVKNKVNQCIVRDTFLMEKLINPIPVITSKMDLIYCTPHNGRIQASVIDTYAPADYKFLWTYHDITNGKHVVDKDTISVINGLGRTEGIFVRVIDNENPTDCVTDLIPVDDIRDLRMYPHVIATEVDPVTNCTNPFNGIASAFVENEDNSLYNFDWYEGSSITPHPAFTGVEFGNLSSTVYTVQATNLFTGCTGTAQIQITNQPIPVPVPVIEILSQVTNCSVQNSAGNNGALAATVNGEIAGYTFNWYNGQSEKTAADFVGDTYTNLITGFYSVIATDDETGCRSPLINEQLLFQPRFPDFDFAVVNATCADPNRKNGQPNGQATMILLSDVEVSKIEWEHLESGEFFTETNIENALPGKYIVTVTSSLNCYTQKQMEIGTEVHAFNGVSRNGDGYNDIFFINCIENFPRNHVKIYNRAGTLVYEAEGYNNADTYFDGRSNKGVSLMGNNLPDGTYFYVIDKRDGSKPVAGYLEVVN
ncbi:gliding motility-associated C-terminal domain-containing protein [Chryseosolibacter indicus]|uniref:Gliding motility-associated C-terminal domain-containing protein n=1 Tax=Chryseosolibacter indicus TaxID=2782351 RepID=A0ABS5VPC4_9BACT|nr:gliding motility-associated C-terminal domain-containing protein [Chryseosolibacter indicus]MBT1703273.1 gliding motility-associated C-terminal domain-containing protein [Chryseosolibacter indicus]